MEHSANISEAKIDERNGINFGAKKALQDTTEELSALSLLGLFQ